MNRYETVFIMTPVLSEDQMKACVADYKKHLTDQGASIIAEDNWGLKKLAYPIKKKSTGFYYCIEFDGPGSLVADLEIAYKRDERLLRFLTVSLDKHAIAFNEKMRSKKSAK
jgi:small subunit ribosomal protein S6